jgi:intracellular multiplication protein IcmK
LARITKALINKMSIVILLLVLSGMQCAFAADDAQPSSTPEPILSQADLDQFQIWLRNNGQAQAAGAQSSRAGRTISKTVTTTSTSRSSRVPLRQLNPLTYEQSQKVILNSVPEGPPVSEESNAAFNMMMQQNMPLTPQQVVKLKQLIDQSQRAAAMPANIPPKPVSSTLMINLAPGATPPAIRLAQGYVTSLVFVDSTGEPWPLASYDIGDPKTSTIQWDGKSNVLLIQATSPYGDSDLVVRLVGMPTPITLELVLGQRVVDYRTDIHVSGLGPNSKDLPTGTGLPNSANQLLLNVLDGVAPPGSRQLTVKGGDCTAWLLGNKMFLRTRLTVLSPGWVGRMVSPDGMYSYEIQRSSSVLVSQYGQPIELKIEGF